MQWQLLFDDLESQFATARARQARAGLADLVRAELATTRLADRLRASLGLSVRLHVGDLAAERDAMVEGDLVDAGEGWLLVTDPQSRQALVPLAAVDGVAGLVPHVAPPPGRVHRGLGLTHALRALARDRVEVQVCTASRTLVGRIDRVGADHLDVTPAAGPAWTVPIAALRVVRSR